MSESPVEGLPEEVLVEVFKWLDTKSLKNVMLTCKEWSDYVRRSHQWTLILEGKLSLGDAEVLLESVLMANRKYNKVMVKGWTYTNSKTLEIFEKHGAFIHELTISWYHSTNASFWCKILNTMANLKTIQMDTNWKVSFSDVSDDELPSLCKLKTLELVGDSTAVLKLFKKCQLHTLNLNIFRINSVPGHQSNEIFWNFMATQKDLSELKLDSYSLALSETHATEKSIPFRLKKLSVTRPAFEMPTNSLNNLMELMKLHKSTLEDLELRETFPNNFYEFVFSEFKRLKTLSLAVGDIPETRLEVNESVTSFQLRYYGWATGLAANTFVSRLPNVQKLMVYGPYDSLLAKCIADNMKQLRSLDIFSYEAKSFDGTRFPALESLRIRRLYGRVNWDAVAKNNPGIKELWIENAFKPKYLNLPGLTRSLKLRKLTIECSELNCYENFFEVIRNNCPDLKSLELNEKSLKVDISTVADIPGLRFRKF